MFKPIEYSLYYIGHIFVRSLPVEIRDKIASLQIDLNWPLIDLVWWLLKPLKLIGRGNLLWRQRANLIIYKNSVFGMSTKMNRFKFNKIILLEKIFLCWTYSQNSGWMNYKKLFVLFVFRKAILDASRT